MTLPKQAQRQADEARRLQEQVVNPEAPVETPVEIVAAAPEEPVAAADPAPAPSEEPEPWEERYHHLEGKYNAEVPRQQAQIRALTEQLADMQQLIASMQTPQPQPQAPQAGGYSPAEIEKFGADLIELIERVCDARVTATKAQFQQDLDGVRGQVGQVSQQQVRTAESDFYEYLDEHVPGWQTLNRDARFLQWLAQPAPLSRVPKQKLLAEAAENFDGPSAAMFFATFVKETTPAPSAPPPEAPRGSELERQVQPSKRGAGSGNAPLQGTKSFTRAEVAQFYTDIARGLWANRPQEKAQREAEIFAAQREGKIA